MNNISYDNVNDNVYLEIKYYYYILKLLNIHNNFEVKSNFKYLFYNKKTCIDKYYSNSLTNII